MIDFSVDIRKCINERGAEILDSPQLYNMLLDRSETFRNSGIIKNVMRNILKGGFFGKLVDIHHEDTGTKILRGEQLVNEIFNQSGISTSLSRVAVANVLMALCAETDRAAITKIHDTFDDPDVDEDYTDYIDDTDNSIADDVEPLMPSGNTSQQNSHSSSSGSASSSSTQNVGTHDLPKGCRIWAIVIIGIILVWFYNKYQDALENTHYETRHQIRQHFHYKDDYDKEITALSNIELSKKDSYRTAETALINDAVCNILMEKYRRNIHDGDFATIGYMVDGIKTRYWNKPNIIDGVTKFETEGRKKVEDEYIKENLWKMKNIESASRYGRDLWPWVPPTLENILKIDPTNERALEIQRYFGL